jgi:hypothetical protein
MIRADGKRGGITMLLVVAALLALVLYPLSIGPVEWLGRQGYIPEAMLPIVKLIYTPLIWLAEQVPSISEFLRQCIRFCNR